MGLWRLTQGWYGGGRPVASAGSCGRVCQTNRRWSGGHLILILD